jgi:hypothetical protein
MAELMLLILFGLLLLFGRRAQVAEPERETVDVVKELREAGVPLASGAGFAEDFTVLVRQAKVGRAVLDGLSDAGGLPDERAASQAASLATLGQQALSALGPNKMGQDPIRAASDFTNKLGSAYGKASKESGSSQLWFETLAKRAAECKGNGLELPPCAVTSDGKAALVFTARLRRDGILLHDNKIEALQEDQAHWPLQMITFDQYLTPARFLAETRAIFEWSNERGCRFFVRIADDTAAAEKMTYKLRLRTVEDHFYKLEPLVNEEPTRR